jgi:hypothetical protein
MHKVKWVLPVQGFEFLQHEFGEVFEIGAGLMTEKIGFHSIALDKLQFLAVTPSENRNRKSLADETARDRPQKSDVARGAQ